MRPISTASKADIYECFDCGVRIETTVAGRCDCGGEFVHLGRSRDL
ncbi:small CPxCG-related zinc finger protein [Natronomonas pharaonis DSM 2160]|uniref:Small CPxCG-related zinc finger protein n=1 Tax=Natronomonas pharaonis (strain ATCC 35678 / DSM 2160 / CIP 103997 / JCM 8858 / NBRC 14720 / NCIMB 2260 / Gabara) TaxID=348780 RepID=A0A1U7EZ57_NATPD|nr:rubrerythrin-like domain-containing protein [Natronomonas pharaonis]CAI50555.1 small CPxCG-related zinc finger protein [Natronomonas pharaonis DSM 2160]